MGYTGSIKKYRNEDLDDREKLQAIYEFREVLGRYGITPALPNRKEFHHKTPEQLKETKYEGPLVLDYRIVETVLREDYDFALFSTLVKRVYEYEEVKGTEDQIALALEGVLRDFPLGLLYYQSNYNTLSWLYFRKMLMD